MFNREDIAMDVIFTALTQFQHRHWLTIDRTRIFLLTALFCKAPMMGAVILEIWAVIKVGRMKMPGEYTSWE